MFEINLDTLRLSTLSQEKSILLPFTCKQWSVSNICDAAGIWSPYSQESTISDYASGPSSHPLDTQTDRYLATVGTCTLVSFTFFAYLEP